MVALLVSAWIETFLGVGSSVLSSVALLVSAWIETWSNPQPGKEPGVALLVSAWIETVNISSHTLKPLSHSS